MIFKTNYPYNKDRLKKVLCRCRKAAADTELTLHVGVIGIEDKAYKQPDGTYGNTSFYEVAVSGEVTDSYVTYVGYVLDTDSVEDIETALLSHPRPNNDPDYPAKLLDGTTDIALMIKTGAGGAGDNEFIYVDSIELQDTENALTELPQGALVINTIEGMSDDNRLTPVEKSYLATLMSEITAEYGDEDGTPVVGIYYAGYLAGVSAANLLALSTAYTNLKNAYVGWTADMHSISTIDGAAFDLLFSTYYAKKVEVQQETTNLVTARISLSVDHSNVNYNGYGMLKYDNIIITAYPVIIENNDLIFKRSDKSTDETGLLTTDALGNPLPSNKRRLACSSVSDDGVVITASAVLGTRTHSSSVTIMVVRDQLIGGANLGGRDTVPTPITEGRPLMLGDYFLWANETGGGYTKGEIYEYNGTGWVKSTNGNLVMTLFDDFAELKNDYDTAVIGAAVIKKLVAIDAFIKNLKAQNLSAGVGDGTAGSGFRFRAMQDQYMAGGNNPVFDVMYNDKVVFKAEPANGKVYFGTNFWYDPADGAIHTPNNKTVIKADGTIEAVDGRFSGDVFAESGYFKGIFDTTALKLEPGDTTTHNFTQASSMYQARNFFNALSSFGIEVTRFYRASTSISSIQLYIQMPNWSGTRTVNLGDLSYIRIVNTIYNGATIYQFQLFDSTKTLIPALSEFPTNSLMYRTSDDYIMTTTSFTITVYIGGDKLIVSPEIPDSPTGLANYQIYHTNGTLQIKLP